LHALTVELEEKERQAQLADEQAAAQLAAAHAAALERIERKPRKSMPKKRSTYVAGIRKSSSRSSEVELVGESSGEDEEEACGDRLCLCVESST
jgi:hypothetical protein